VPHKKFTRILLAAVSVLSVMLFSGSDALAAGGTTSVTVTKYASDKTTILSEQTVTYQYLRDNLPVQGDGTTHYYHQGPVFLDDTANATNQELLRWNAAEDRNVQEKDMGAVKGTNFVDLCNMVGGMAAGDSLKVQSSDGWSKLFAYKNVYQYSNREGPMVLTWFKDGLYPDTGYTDGMRLVWFADASTNPWGVNAFGNWDWHQAADPQYWYFYVQSGQNYPTTTGISAMYVSKIMIYSTFSVPFWDLNKDHICNIADLGAVGLKWGQSGASGWLPEDANKDGYINIGDIVTVGLHWGKSW
jgi:hypothetical protein